MRHQLRFLTVLLLSFVVGMVSAQTLIQRADSYDGLSYSFNDDNYLTLNNGTRLLLRAAGSGNHDYYFAGAAVKTTDAATAEVYIVESVGTYDFTDTNSNTKTVSTFRLKRESDNNYVKAPSAVSGAIEMTTEQTEAAVFFAYNPDGVIAGKPNTKDIWTEIDTDDVIRLQTITNVTTYLNAGGIGKVSAWANGTGGLSIWALYIAPAKEDTGDTTEATAEELQAAIDKANALFATKALITSASQLNSNHKESTEGSYEGLLADYSLGTDAPYFYFFHSNWSDETNISADDPHDLQVVQFDNADDLATFTVKYKARNGNNRPTTIKVYGGTYDNSTTTWETTSFATLTTDDGLGEDEGEFSFTADKVYNAFRFVVTETNTGSIFFTYGRFQLYSTDYTTTNGFTADDEDILTFIEAIEAAQSAIYAGSGYGDALEALNAVYDTFYAKAEVAKQQLQSAIDECKEELADAEETAGPGYASEENLNTLSEAIAEAEELIASGATDEEYVATKAALEATAETALQDAISFPTDRYFTITNDRGALVYDESTEYIWFGTADSSDPNHLWGFYKDESTGNYYLYNVGAKLFAASNGTGSYGKTWILTGDASSIALSLTWRDSGNTIGDHKVSIKGGDNYMSISPNYTGPVVTYYYDGDGGVPFLFAKSSYTFDQDLYDSFTATFDRQKELSALIAEAKKVYAKHPDYQYKKGDKLILDASQFNSNNKEQSEGSYAALLDGNASTYFHSNYHGGGEEPHDLQVTFENTDNQLTYVVEYEARKNNGAYTTGTRPAQISIYGGTYTDGSVTWNTTPFVTLTTDDGLAEEKGSFSFTADKTYNALRFAVDKTNGSWDNNYVYFTYGEFQLYPAEASSLNLSIVAGLERAIEAAESASFEDLADDATYYDLYYTLVDAMDDALTNYDVVTLNADIVEAREKYAVVTAKQGTPGYLDDEAAETFTATIEHAEEVANEVTSTRDDIAAASTALSTAVDKYYGHSWVSYPETSYFVITNARGSIVYDAEHASTLDTKLGKEFIWYAAEPDETDLNNLWGFLTDPATGEHYIYNVGQELFANCNGQGSFEKSTTWVLSNEPSPITMSELDFPTLRIMSGDNTMSVSTGYVGPIICYYDEGDGGVPFSFAKSSVEFDEGLYQAMADLAGVVTGVNGVSTTSSLSVSGGQGCLTITSNAPASVSVTALSGVVVAHASVGASSATTIALPAGIYVVAGQKVVVK